MMVCSRRRGRRASSLYAVARPLGGQPDL